VKESSGRERVSNGRVVSVMSDIATSLQDINSKTKEESLRRITETNSSTLQAVCDNQEVILRNMERLFENVDTVFSAVKRVANIPDEVVLKPIQPFIHRRTLPAASKRSAPLPVAFSKLHFPLHELTEFKTFNGLLKVDENAASMARYLGGRHGAPGMDIKQFTLAAVAELLDLSINRIMCWRGSTKKLKELWKAAKVASIKERLSFTEEDDGHRIENLLFDAACLGCGEWPDPSAQRREVCSGIAKRLHRRDHKTEASRVRQAYTEEQKKKTAAARQMKAEAARQSSGEKRPSTISSDDDDGEGSDGSEEGGSVEGGKSADNNSSSIGGSVDVESVDHSSSSSTGKLVDVESVDSSSSSSISALSSQITFSNGILYFNGAPFLPFPTAPPAACNQSSGLGLMPGAPAAEPVISSPAPGSQDLTSMTNALAVSLNAGVQHGYLASR
jgi:hypothetical protein